VSGVRSSVSMSWALALAIATAVSGCGGPSLVDSLQESKSSGQVFDWLNSKSAPSERRAERPEKVKPADLQTEIYYGQTTAAKNPENDGAFVPARLSTTTPGGASTLRVQTNGKGSTQAADGSINLSFENADIKAVARAILGEMFGLNFTIEPGLTGAISLSTRRPIRRDQVMIALETALRTQGAVLVKEGGFVRIVSDKDAAGMGRTNVGRDAGEGGFGITAFPLENISGDALLKILDGFGAPANSVRIDQERNLLLIRGTYSERQQIVETALAFDVDWMRSQTVGIIPVRTGSPEAVIADLNKIVDPNVVRTQPIERLNAILAVSQNPDAIRQASDWISRLDRRSDGSTRVRVYKLKYGDARRVASMVRDMFGNGTQISVDAGQVAPRGERVSARVAATTTSSGGSQQTDGRSGTATTVAVETPAPDGLSAAGKIRITADIANNSVVVHSSQQEAVLIEQAIRDLDRAPAQVAIEATIAEITLNDALSNGVQFYLKGKWGAISQQQDNLPLSRVVPGMNLLLGNEATPNLVLDALRSKTEVKILSSPSLVVVDNQPAVLLVGDQVPITTRTAQATTDPLAPVVNSIDFRDTGVILRITPQVHAHSMVGIDIEQEISSVKASSKDVETLTPTISQRRVKSTVSVADGQTLVLGGLISEQKTKSKSGIPGVIDIPVLGNILAGRNQDENVRTELIIFLRPHVVRNMVDARKVAEDLRQRMKGFDRW
jgi:general secretion pathway protein D